MIIYSTSSQEKVSS